MRTSNMPENAGSTNTLTRRTLLQGGLGVVSAAPTIIRGWCQTAEAERVPTRAIDLVQSTPVVDMMGLITTDWARLERWRSDQAGLDAQDLDAIVTSGVSLFHPAVRLQGPNLADRTASWMGGWRQFAEFHPDRFRLVEGLQDWSTVRAREQVGILLGSQDSAHFESAADVETFAALGQRVSQLTYNGLNQLGGGCGLSRDPGLSPLGGEIVSAMNRTGMIVDLSHCGERTTLDAIEASNRTVLVTHSNCAALAPGQARCKSDEVIRKLASCGGVVGVTAISNFVTHSRPVRFEHVLDHFDHIARLTGTEHVGLGTDGGVLGAQRNLAPGFGRPDTIFRLTDGLIRRGYSNAEIRRMLGFNFERVIREHLDPTR